MFHCSRCSGASPAKMLRIAAPPGGLSPREPRNRSPLRQKEENNLRRHIVGMVREQSGDINLDNMKAGESTVIYQIKKKGGIAQLKPTQTAEDSRNDTMKRVHMKAMRATRAKGLRQFPALDSYADIINNENNETINVNEPSKRIRTLHIPNEERPRGASAKNVRFKLEDKSTHVPLSPFPGYEVRGNAIRSGSLYSKSAPTARRSEVQQRQAHIHTSLQLFKRRLKLNQDSSYLAPNSTIRESDYIIRRIPIKLEPNARIPNVTPVAPLEPRLNVTTKVPQRPKTPNTRPITPTSAIRRLAPQTARPVSGGNKSHNSDNPERKIRFSYRLPDNLSLGKEVSFMEESEPIPSVNTYVLEESKRKGNSKFETQATLSAHNLGVHDALTANDHGKVHVGDESEVDQRLVKWVEESNVNNHTRKMTRLRSERGDNTHTNDVALFLTDDGRSLTVA